MTVHRVHNFNPGPAALPLPVLEEVRESFLDFRGTGMSIVEISHRSKPFEAVLNGAIERIRRLLGLDTRHHVIFVQGGASLQFAMVPLNLLPEGASADYVNTGTWATNAIREARLLGKTIRIAASSEDREFTYIPAKLDLDPQAAYLHLTSNNTIRGTQWWRFPETGDVPLVADMSSDILSRPIPAARFGLIYAGAQKNLGPAGVAVVIVREDLLGRVPETLPTMLRYTTYTKTNSLYNTPPCFAIYVVERVLCWLEESVGGLEAMAAINRRKAERLYAAIDASGGFYRGTAEPASRSQMNVTFRLPDAEREQRFLEEAARAGLAGLKGHRSVGGCRASLYNAVSLEAVEALVSFMKDFAVKNG